MYDIMSGMLDRGQLVIPAGLKPRLPLTVGKAVLVEHPSEVCKAEEYIQGFLDDLVFV